MILAVRLHPEGPRSTDGFCDPGLCSEAEAHSAHPSRIRRQGRAGRAGRRIRDACCRTRWPARFRASA
jgi:hypothetical protein